MFVPVMRLLDLLPVPLITHVYTGEHFGTRSDVAPPMKYRLWRDLRSSTTVLGNLPPSLTTIVTSIQDKIGNGGEQSMCDDIRSIKLPGHASFRSLACMSAILSMLERKEYISPSLV